jgi:hypothetical protein
MLFSVSLQTALAPALWISTGIAAFFGFIALVSPKTFAKLARSGNHWIDTSQLLNKLDARVDIDSRVLPHSRWLGAAVLLALGLAWFSLSR